MTRRQQAGGDEAANPEPHQASPASGDVRHAPCAALNATATRVKPGNTRSSVDQAIAAPEAAIQPRLARQTAATADSSQSSRRYAPPM